METMPFEENVGEEVNSWMLRSKHESLLKELDARGGNVKKDNRSPNASATTTSGRGRGIRGGGRGRAAATTATRGQLDITVNTTVSEEKNLTI